MDLDLVNKNLFDLTKLVFSEKYQFIGEMQKLKGNSGKFWTFNAMVKNSSSLFGMFIRDWKREISITQLRQLHKACLDVPGIEGGIMVCNIISESSKEYSDQFGIQILSRGHLISKLRNKR